MGAELAVGAMIAGGVASAVGTGVSIYGTIQQGKAAKKQAEYTAALSENEAAWARYKGKKEADRIRRSAARLKANQAAGYAAAGVDVGEGTPIDLFEETTYEAELDALNAIGSGEYRAGVLESEAELYRTAGKNYDDASMVSAIGQGLTGMGSLLETGARGYDRWQRWES